MFVLGDDEGGSSVIVAYGCGMAFLQGVAYLYDLWQGKLIAT